jgi:hypothetical protein
MLSQDFAKGGPLMSTLYVPGTAWEWPADVLAFATQHQVAAYLGPLLEATQRLFPTAHGLRVFLETDPEVCEEQHIVFEARVPKQDVPDFVRAVHSWTDEFHRACPSLLRRAFQLALLRVDT